jgi:uncharacterized membrane protein YcjF (UPF0283 family)
MNCNATFVFRHLFVFAVSTFGRVAVTWSRRLFTKQQYFGFAAVAVNVVIVIVIIL